MPTNVNAVPLTKPEPTNGTLPFRSRPEMRKFDPPPGVANTFRVSLMLPPTTFTHTGPTVCAAATPAPNPSAAPASTTAITDTRIVVPPVVVIRVVKGASIDNGSASIACSSSEHLLARVVKGRIVRERYPGPAVVVSAQTTEGYS